ncbi:MAG TPA: LPS export ABC transporter periplasmic protein LptC [Dongiaceae bacterium]|nr:LPS export ABC transporter periplasmic protein LptC [Dongiaceae bacterium]
MTGDSGNEQQAGAGRRTGFPDLIAPRRIFKRKKRSNWLLALKIGLPLIAVVCVAYIVIWSRVQLPNITINPVEATSDAAKPTSDVTVSRVKYDGVDARNRPFSITAEAASQPDNTPAADPNATVPAGAPAQNAQQSQPAPKPDSIINLKQIIADMTMTDGAWVAVTADNGVYDRDNNTVDLSGNVTLFHDTGLQFQTDAAKVDLRNDTAQGDQPVEGQNPDGTLAAEGFQVLNDGRTVIFLGRSYMKIYPKSHGSGEPATGGTVQ